MKYVRAVLASILASTTFCPPALALDVQFRAGVVKGNGDVKPVARQEFIAFPWNPATLVDEVLAEDGIPAAPNPEQYKKVAAEFLETKITYDPGYYVAYDAWRKRVIDAIKGRMTKSGRKPVAFKTDLNGMAKVDLAAGEYYFFGSYVDNFATLTWNSRFAVDEKHALVELSNDNASGLRLADQGNIKANDGFLLHDPVVAGSTTTNYGNALCTGGLIGLAILVVPPLVMVVLGK